MASHGIQGDGLKVAMGHHREDLGDPGRSWVLGDPVGALWWFVGSCLMKSRPKWTSRDLVTGFWVVPHVPVRVAGCGMVGLKLDRCPTTFNCS